MIVTIIDTEINDWKLQRTYIELRIRPTTDFIPHLEAEMVYSKNYIAITPTFESIEDEDLGRTYWRCLIPSINLYTVTDSDVGLNARYIAEWWNTKTNRRIGSFTVNNFIISPEMTATTSWEVVDALSRKYRRRRSQFNIDLSDYVTLNKTINLIEENLTSYVEGDTFETYQTFITNNYYTQDYIGDNFYTKEEVDVLIAGVTEVNPADYYLKTQTYNQTEIDDLIDGVVAGGVTDEHIEDVVGALVIAGDGIEVVYTDGAGTLEISADIPAIVTEVLADPTFDDAVNSAVNDGITTGIIDDFDTPSPDGDLWNVMTSGYNSLNQTGSYIEFTAPATGVLSSFAMLQSKKRYDILDKILKFNFINQTTPQTGVVEYFCRIIDGAGDFYEFYKSDYELRSFKKVAGVVTNSVAVSFGSGAYWFRFRPVSGSNTLFFESSSNNINWSDANDTETVSLTGLDTTSIRIEFGVRIATVSATGATVRVADIRIE